MFGISAVELVIILVLAILLFGPEKMPEYSRKAARIFVYLRGIANNTQQSLRDQLGPEFADLELRDLHPKAFIQKHLSQEIAAIEEAKREIEQMKAQLDDAKEGLESEVAETGAAAKAVGKKQPGKEDAEEAPVFAVAPFDPEAT